MTGTLSSDYGAWNDYSYELLGGRLVAWDLTSLLRPGIEQHISQRPTQVCLPYLRGEWVREIRPLPTAGWDELDLSQSA
jgi:hypothetical protein